MEGEDHGSASSRQTFVIRRSEYGDRKPGDHRPQAASAQPCWCVRSVPPASASHLADLSVQVIPVPESWQVDSRASRSQRLIRDRSLGLLLHLAAGAGGSTGNRDVGSLLPAGGWCGYFGRRARQRWPQGSARL